jgi:uncharacterized membrane protein
VVVIRQHVGVHASIAVLLASLLAVAVRLDAPAAVQVPLGLVVAFVVPGWLGFRAFRGHPPRTLIDAALSLSGSIGILIALGISLDLFDPGLTPETWSLGLLVISTVLALVAVSRHRTSPETPRASPDALSTESGSRGRRPIQIVVQVLISVALLSGAAITTLSSQREENATQPLTELWLAGDQRTQIVHVVNREGRPMSYRLAVSVQGERRAVTEFQLAAGKEWVSSVNMPKRRRGDEDAPVLAVSLYRGDEEAAYRKVHVHRPGP